MNSPARQNHCEAKCGPARFLLATVSLCWALSAAALSSDADQPIYVEADSVEIDEQLGTSTYRGNVKVTQGSLHLTADMITIVEVENAKTITATGSPVRFRQLPDGEDQPVHGRSLRAEYQTESGVLTLYEKAHIDHGQNTFSSDRIQYNSHTATVLAGRAASGQKRVHSTIHPREDRDKKPGEGQ